MASGGRSRVASEFAGRPGLIQADTDGHVEMSAGEAAMVMRRQGFSDVVGRTFAEQTEIDEQFGGRGDNGGPRGEPAVDEAARVAAVNAGMLPAEPLWGRGLHNETLAEHLENG